MSARSRTFVLLAAGAAVATALTTAAGSGASAAPAPAHEVATSAGVAKSPNGVYATSATSTSDAQLC